MYSIAPVYVHNVQVYEISYQEQEKQENQNKHYVQERDSDDDPMDNEINRLLQDKIQKQIHWQEEDYENNSNFYCEKCEISMYCSLYSDDDDEGDEGDEGDLEDLVEEHEFADITYLVEHIKSYVENNLSATLRELQEFGYKLLDNDTEYLGSKTQIPTREIRLVHFRNIQYVDSELHVLFPERIGSGGSYNVSAYKFLEEDSGGSYTVSAYKFLEEGSEITEYQCNTYDVGIYTFDM